MPARRDLHTGRLNFLHRSWGPLEPFDNSFPVLLQEGGVHSHLVSDHYHYFEDGGWTYHQRYSSWDFVRGQEADKWKAMVQPPLERFEEKYHEVQYETDPEGFRFQHMVNREWIRRRGGLPGGAVLPAQLRFPGRQPGRRQLAAPARDFDPHEPFFAPARFARTIRPTTAGRSSTGRAIAGWSRARRDRRTARQLRRAGGDVRRVSRAAAGLHGPQGHVATPR